MEEEIKKTAEALDSPGDPQKVLHKMEIVMLPDGNIGLRTSTNNKAVCKALLAGAEELLNQPQQQQIVIPRMGLAGKITGRG